MSIFLADGAAVRLSDRRWTWNTDDWVHPA